MSAAPSEQELLQALLDCSGRAREIIRRHRERDDNPHELLLVYTLVVLSLADMLDQDAPGMMAQLMKIVRDEERRREEERRP